MAKWCGINGVYKDVKECKLNSALCECGNQQQPLSRIIERAVEGFFDAPRSGHQPSDLDAIIDAIRGVESGFDRDEARAILARALAAAPQAPSFETWCRSKGLTPERCDQANMWIREAYEAGKQAPSGQQAEPTDAQLIALNAGERFFSESPTKYPEAGHGTQYHAGAPGVVGFARAAIALAGQQSERPAPASLNQQVRESVLLSGAAPAGQAVGMLADVEALLREAYDHWDADREYKVGKILLALIGHNKGYDKRAEAFRVALAASQAAVKEDGNG